MLTGDKVDTAKNIGFSCRLLVNEGMEIFQYPKNTADLYQATSQIREKQKTAIQDGQKTAFLVAGNDIETIMSKKNKELYQLVGFNSKSVCQTHS